LTAILKVSNRVGVHTQTVAGRLKACWPIEITIDDKTLYAKTGWWARLINQDQERTVDYLQMRPAWLAS
jgi:hypothetical protein